MLDVTVLRQVVEDLIPFNKHVGVKLIAVSRGNVRLEVPFREELIGDPMRRALHGGVMSTLADASCGAALWSHYEDPRTRISTIDLRIDYLRPGRQETLVAEATVVRGGRRIGVVDVRLFHPSTPLETIATGKGVFNVSALKEPSA
jgi:uncharacterized protein (TIGR00369 family)